MALVNVHVGIGQLADDDNEQHIFCQIWSGAATLRLAIRVQ